MTTPAAALVQLFGLQQTHDQRLRFLQSGLQESTMMAKFADVTRTYQLSQPLVLAFQAVPGFNQALESFPKQELLNLVPEHSSSPTMALALESFTAFEGEQVNTLSTRAQGLTEGFNQLLSSIENTASSLREQLTTAEEKLDLVSDLDELVASTPVTSLSDSAYSTTLSVIEEHLGQVTHFNTDELRAHPAMMSDEASGFAELANKLGPVLGFALAEYGIVDAERAPDYQPGTQSFSAMGLTKSSLHYHMAKGQEILNLFDLVAGQRDHLVQALLTESQAMPDTQHTDEVSYGFEAHSVLLGCYTGFITKLIMGGVYAISMLLQVADTVLIEMGHN